MAIHRFRGRQKARRTSAGCLFVFVILLTLLLAGCLFLGGCYSPGKQYYYSPSVTVEGKDGQITTGTYSVASPELLTEDEVVLYLMPPSGRKAGRIQPIEENQSWQRLMDWPQGKHAYYVARFGLTS